MALSWHPILFSSQKAARRRIESSQCCAACAVPNLVIEQVPYAGSRTPPACTDGALEVRAVRPISKGEQLTVSYINPTEPRKIRATELLETKFFLCACERCTEPIAGTADMMLEVRSSPFLTLTPSSESLSSPGTP